MWEMKINLKIEKPKEKVILGELRVGRRVILF
jgi:hypothetical protein